MDRRVKVLFMIDFLGTNLAGTENQIIKMINGLSKKKFEVTLVCFASRSWLDNNIDQLDCNTFIYDINKFRRIGTYISIIRLFLFIRKLCPDVVHTFFPVSNIVGAIVARSACVKAVISSRRDYGEWMVGYYLKATRLANRFVTTITTNSHQVKNLTIDKEGVAADKILVIYNGIDIDGFRRNGKDASLLRELGIGPECSIVGIIANFRPMKHHHTFIHAANEVLKIENDVHFVLVGEDAGCGERSIQCELEQLVATMGIGKNVHFVGARNDVKRFLSIMDIGVNCSEGEGLSNAIMEYMAAAIPCIASDAGGNPDLVVDEETGIIFQLDDFSKLSEGIIRLLSDSSTRNRMAENARRRVELEMSMEAMLGQYSRLYEDLSQDP